MTRSNRSLAILVGTAMVLALTACGNRTPANPPIDEAEEGGATTTPAAEPTPAGPTTPTVPTTPTTPVAPPITGSLVVTMVEKNLTGIIFFKHLECKGSVLNTANVPLSGKLKIDYKNKKGIINKTLVSMEIKEISVPQLAPGQSYPFTVKSDKSGPDDCEVTVSTNQPPAAASATGGAYGAPGATAYGQTYGAPARAAYPTY